MMKSSGWVVVGVVGVVVPVSVVVMGRSQGVSVDLEDNWRR